MEKYLLHLGHSPALSYAEIVSAHGRCFGRPGSIERIESAAILDWPASRDMKAFCDELGGTVRAAKILASENSETPLPLDALTPEYLIEHLLDAKIDQLLLKQDKRPLFGLSLISPPETVNSRTVHALLNQTAAKLKECLREQDSSCRFVLPDPKGKSFCLSGAQVDKNNMLSDGMEIVLFLHPSRGLQIGQTVWLQGYEEYSIRDYGRPGRDSRSGMLPPKLARILINLARTSETQTILDPFCGSGGIITEAGLMGLQATGFDTSKKAIDDTAKNWEWLQSNVEGVNGTVRVFTGDARSLHSLCEPQYFDACACEPYLGPPVNNPLNPSRFDSLSKELTPLYIRALAEIRTAVKPGARVVFIVPRFILNGKKSAGTMPVLSEIKLQGYTILDPMSHFTPSKGRSTLIYSRPKQIVQREIFVLSA